MAFQKLPEDQRRNKTIYLTLNKHEEFILNCIAARLNLSTSETLRRLIEEDNERHHYDLIEPEYMRPRNRQQHGT